MTGTAVVPQSTATRKAPLAQERKYKCTYCARAFSRSEHRSRHERSHTKERPFKCLKCRSTFVRRDLLLRHDRTVHAKDGGIPLHSEVKRKSNTKQTKPTITIEQSNLDSLDDGMVDLETAAVLMTELHHAAAAALLDQDQELEKRRREASVQSADSYDGPAMYTSGALPVRDINNWDPPTPSSGIERGSSLQPPNHLGHLMNRSLSADRRSVDRRSATPSSHFGYSYTATPTVYSPYPSSPLGLHAFTSAVSPPPQPPQVADDDERRAILDSIRDIDGGRNLPRNFRLPSKSALNRYMSTYFNLFHHHLPFLQPATFHAATVAPPLLLSVLSIGALYTFEKEQAFQLHTYSKTLIQSFLASPEYTSRNCPLWITQCCLLNIWFASWSGDAKGLDWAASQKVLMSTLVTGGTEELVSRIERRGDAQPSREEWLEEEGRRRTYFATYVFFGLLTLTFNHLPELDYRLFNNLSLPCSETLWHMDAADEITWREQLALSPCPTFREAQSELFAGDVPHYSSFGARIMINALFVEVWFVKRECALQSVPVNYNDKIHVALDTWHKSTEICTPEHIIIPLTAPQKSHPLLFNAMAMYRTTISRLEIDLHQIQQALRYHVPGDVAALMTAASAQIRRSSAMTKVIQQCFECFQIPALMGIRWVARTSALNWSVEHPLCGFDLMLILSLWLYKMEEEAESNPPTVEEAEMLTKVRTLFDDDSVELYGSRLSAAVAHIWGGMIDEVYVWGITKMIGEAFKLHSHSLAIDVDDGMTPTAASSPSSTPGAEDDDMEN